MRIGNRSERFRRSWLGDSGAAIVELGGAAGNRYLVFSWAFRGGNKTQRTSGALTPTAQIQCEIDRRKRTIELRFCSADGKWAYYWGPCVATTLAGTDGRFRENPKMFPGGALFPETFPAGTGLSPSPDGKVLAYVLATMPTSEDPLSSV